MKREWNKSYDYDDQYFKTLDDYDDNDNDYDDQCFKTHFGEERKQHVIDWFNSEYTACKAYAKCYEPFSVRVALIESLFITVISFLAITLYTWGRDRFIKLTKHLKYDTHHKV